MATIFSGKIQVQFSLNYQNTTDFDPVKGGFVKTYSFDWTDGGGANQAQKLFVDQRTVATGANDDIDLAGALVDQFGATLTFTAVKGLWLYSLPANTTNLTIGGASSTWVAWNSGTNAALTPITPGAPVLLLNPSATGWASISGGSTDILRISNSAGASAVYDLVIFGEG